MIFSVAIKACAVAASALFVTLAMAGDGHDHGEAKPTAAGPASPRFTAQSDLFEAVGILGKEELVVYIDRAASNEPVVNATVELASTGIKLVGMFEAKLGEYHFDAKPFAKTGENPITLTVKAGADSDLLAGELDVHDAGTAASTAMAGAHAHGWQRAAQWGGGGLVVALLLFFGVRRLIANRRNGRNRLGVAA
jgi:hypothetical protein